MQPCIAYSGAVLALAGLAIGPAIRAVPADDPQAISVEARKQIERDLKKLGDKFAALRGGKGDKAVKPEWLADAEIFHKSVVWALRYDKKFSRGDVALIQKALRRGGVRGPILSW
jgi:hypothetical protein